MIAEIEIRALKIYSPQGPRNGIVIIFLTQSTKSLWLSKMSEMITFSSDPSSPLFSPLPTSPHPRLSSSVNMSESNTSSSIFNLKHRRAHSRTVLRGSEHHAHHGHTHHSAPARFEDTSASSLRSSPILMSESCVFSFDKKASPDIRYVY